MKIVRVTSLFLFLVAVACRAMASDLVMPEPALALPHHDYLVPGKPLLAGVRLEQNSDVVLEPHLGLGHARREREVRSGYDEITHTIHARAGGSVSLFQTVSLSAAAKVPVYSVELSDRWLAGGALSQPGSRRYGYDILRPGDKLSWTGEVGIRLGEQLDFSLYYDQNRFSDTAVGSNGANRHDDRFGTRFIFRFK